MDKLAREIPMPVLVEWMAFYRVEPWGDPWRQSGRLATIVAAAAGAKPEGSLEEKFLPGGGIYRGLNAEEMRTLDQLRKVPGFENHRSGC